MNTPIVLALITLGCGGIIRFFSKVAGSNEGYGPTYMVAQSIAFGSVAIIIHFVQYPVHLSPYSLITWVGGYSLLKEVGRKQPTSGPENFPRASILQVSSHTLTTRRVSAV